ncbi:hypothetical protein OROGR_020333 [Orobanche gracilis]
MLVKPDTTDINSPPTTLAATACGNCGAEERRLLHHVRHRGVFRRLCTSCVLRLHPQSFCPTCFQVYPPQPSHDAVLTCIKCYSSSHSHCVEAGGHISPPSSYICPLCSRPNTPIFKLKSAIEANMEVVNTKTDDIRVMDRDSAKKLLAAAKIASMLMNKAAVAAKADAERRAKDAAYTLKRAKEALEYVTHLTMKENLRKKEAVLAGSSGVGINVGYTGGGGVKIDRENSNVNVSASHRNRNVTGVLGQPMAVDGKIVSGGNVDNSNRVLSALNAVELRENEQMRSGITARGSGLGVHLDHVAMDGERSNGTSCVNFENMDSGEENMDTLGEQIDEDVDDDEADLVQFVEDHMEDDEESHDGEQCANAPQQL